MLLALMLFSMVSISAELILLEHTESRIQWVPFVTLGVGSLATIFVALQPSRPRLQFYRFIMLGFIVVGALGLWFHYKGNAEFELEMMPELAGMQLFKASIRGATPLLAPGAIAQLGLLGFIFTLGHPHLATRSSNNKRRAST